LSCFLHLAGIFEWHLTVGTLGRYYFVEGHSLNDRQRVASVVAEELVTLLDAAKVEIQSEVELLAFLNGNEGRKEIEEALQALRQLGIHSIPKFIVEGKTIIDGAAHSEVFVQVFRDIERHGKIQSGPVFGEILGVPKEIVERGSHTPETVAA
jgi:predicted DsbA family dithiol-disulfide isomerase